jgi:hypothetical protein
MYRASNNWRYEWIMAIEEELGRRKVELKADEPAVLPMVKGGQS